jgi:hypothetical protein
MPVKKFKDPFSSVTSLQATQPNGVSQIEKLKTSESPVRPKAEPPKRYGKEFLKDKWKTLSGSIMEWVLEEDSDGRQARLETLLAETKLKDIGVMLGIATEKVLLLDGSPTQIIGTAEQKKLDELFPALMNEVKRRGSTVKLTERTAEIEVPPTKHGS